MPCKTSSRNYLPVFSTRRSVMLESVFVALAFFHAYCWSGVGFTLPDTSSTTTSALQLCLIWRRGGITWMMHKGLRCSSRANRTTFLRIIAVCLATLRQRDAPSPHRSCFVSPLIDGGSAGSQRTRCCRSSPSIIVFNTTSWYFLRIDAEKICQLFWDSLFMISFKQPKGWQEEQKWPVYLGMT